MAGSELELSGGGLSKEQSGVLNTVYDGITMHHTSNGDVGIGVGVDLGTVARAGEKEASDGEIKVMRRISYGSAILDLTLPVAAIAMETTGGMSGAAAAAFSGMGVGLSAISVGASRIPTFFQKRRRKAVAELSEKMTYIPSRNLSVEIDGMPEEIPTPYSPIPTTELVTILRKLQTSHLSPENASNYLSEYPGTVNPAMVVKAALLSLEQVNREPFLHPVFDSAVELNRLTKSLNSHAALRVTDAGREGLRRQTTTLLDRLGVIATTFVDLKSSETLPGVEALISIADDDSLRAGLEEARVEMQQPGLRMKRYELVTQNWQAE